MEDYNLVCVQEMLLAFVTLVGIGLSTAVLALFVFILLFEFHAVDSKLAIGLAIVFILAFDLFSRTKLAVGRMYIKGDWAAKARKYAGFGVLYLLLPLIFTFSDKYGHSVDKLQGLDKSLILGTMVYNLLLSFF